MSDESHFATSGWSPEGRATLEAAGRDARAALEAGLRAVLQLSGGPAGNSPVEERAVPVQGEAPDLASLFAKLAADLFAALSDVGSVPRDFVLDGVLPRDEGGYRAWGYAFIERVSGSVDLEPPDVVDATVREHGLAGVVLRATLRQR